MLRGGKQPSYVLKNSFRKVSEILGISADRLRSYDEEGLCAPYRAGKGIKRLYSELDIEWLKDVRFVISKNKMNIYSFKLMLAVLSRLPDKNFKEIASKWTNDNIWSIFERMKCNPNFAKLAD